jgi:hypothetical protein
MRQQMLGSLDKLSDEQKLAKLKDQDDTHAIAKRKEAEMSKMAKALGVKGAVRVHPPTCIMSGQGGALHERSCWQMRNAFRAACSGQGGQSLP